MAQSKKTDKKSTPEAQPKRPWQLIVKLSVITIVAIVCVVYTDKKGYFLTDQKSPHHERRWESIYRLTPQDTIDVVVLGNSHVNTGINPKHLSCALGCTAFDMAPSGTGMVDAYFCLKEILTRTKPSLVVVETYLMNGTDTHDLKEEGLANEFRSFYPRRNIPIKLTSMPALFTVNNYLPAWSFTLRNHEMLFRNPEEIKENQLLLEKKRRHPDKSLYLGRFVRFTSGITDSVMNLYNTLGPAVDGAECHLCEQVIRYTHKIVELCEKNDIQVIFFTIPMYYRHVTNYDAWRKEQARAIEPTGKPWFNMQQPYDNRAFGRECFESTHAGNQHMTYYGSLVTTYKLAHYIVDSLHISLPDRTKEKRWHKLFYGQEGYFENFSPQKNDKNFTILLRDTTINNLVVKDFTVDHDNNVILKVPKGSQLPNTVLADVTIDYNGNEQIVRIPLNQDGFSFKYHTFVCRLLSGIRVKRVENLCY
ncbi:MAG: hypothetical protein E7074_01960 [Bacteroidales bacterium]|nr:hypothetical protein [Bacteroidales bacterium]